MGRVIGFAARLQKLTIVLLYNLTLGVFMGVDVVHYL
jgi:hypothetical protein